MMASKREVDAYRRRLAKISESGNPAAALTAECLQAVVTYRELWDGEDRVGTLVGYSHRLGEGLLGTRIITDITVCTGCVHKRGQCGPDSEVSAKDVAVLEIVRNGDGADEQAAS